VRIGERGLPAPENLSSGPLTVAIRPEDMAVVPETTTRNGTWPGQITQLSDLGHYRKAFVDVVGVGTLKLYLPKSSTVSEGDTVTLYPTRYLIYPQDNPPLEVKRSM